MTPKSISIFQIQVFSAQCTNLQCSCITYAVSIFRKGTGSCVFLRKRQLGFDTRAGPHWGGTRKRIHWNIRARTAVRMAQSLRAGPRINTTSPMGSCRIYKGKWRHAIRAGTRCGSLPLFCCTTRMRSADSRAYFRMIWWPARTKFAPPSASTGQPRRRLARFCFHSLAEAVPTGVPTIEEANPVRDDAFLGRREREQTPDPRCRQIAAVRIRVC